LQQLINFRKIKMPKRQVQKELGIDGSTFRHIAFG